MQKVKFLPNDLPEGVCPKCQVRWSECKCPVSPIKPASQIRHDLVERYGDKDEI